MRCKLLVPDDTSVCPNCGSREFSDRWDGMVVILDATDSKVASLLGIKKPGMYALKVKQ
ncbi:MAG: transcription elongation factor subunit Spt4 [Thermoprotei archaeon]